jgi:hypothetical protein
MSVTEISAAGGKTKTMSSSRLGGAWPLIAIGVAVAANAAWIGFLGYGLSKLF